MRGARGPRGAGARIRAAGIAVARVLARPLNAALFAGALALLVALAGPPGGDEAAHLYQTQSWRDHGWQLWDNLWYAGRYAQVNYSLLFYPLAGLAGAATVAALSAAATAAAFAATLRRVWPAVATGPAALFALLTPLAVAAGTYPFLLGLAFAMAALAALATGRRTLTVVLALLTALGHPLALGFLTVVLMALAVSTPRWWHRPADRRLALGIGAVLALQAVLLRGFDTGGARYPFDPKDALAIAAFCGAGLLLARGVPDQRLLRAVFAGYGLTAALAFLVPSPLGGNVVRLLLLFGAPLLLLPIAARGFRPRAIATICLAGVLTLQALPAVAGWRTATSARAGDPSYWYPAIAFLEQHRDPNYRVQVVATADNWEAYYLARRGFALARGWFRQDDFPTNAVLYEPLTPRVYQAWMRRLGVRHVLLPDDPLDASAGNEARLLHRGSGLRVVARSGGWTVFELPDPTPIATPAGGIEVLSLTEDAVTLRVRRPGRYRLRLRYTPYWRVRGGDACVQPDGAWSTRLVARRAGLVRLSFDVGVGSFVGAVVGRGESCRPAPGARTPLTGF